MNDFNPGIDFVFGGNNNSHQTANRYFDFDINLERNGGNFNHFDADGNVDEPIRLVKNAIAYAFSIATLSTTGGEEIKQNRYVWHVSTTKRLLTSENVDLRSYFDEIYETHNGTEGSSLNKILIDNHEEVSDRRRVKGHLPLEHNFGNWKTVWKVTKVSGLLLYLKTADLPDLFYTTIVVDSNIFIVELSLFIATFAPIPTNVYLINQKKFYPDVWFLHNW